MLTSGFIFDYSKCVGCHACIVACYNENKTNPPIAWRQVNTLNQKKVPLAGFLNLSIACNHCTEAPCLKACPAKAYIRDIQTGAVIHQPERCIGCKYCTWACPYDAPKFNKTKGIVEKCHLCNHLISKGLIPACANQCPTSALSFGTFEEDDQLGSFGIPKTEFKPRILTKGSNVLNNIPKMDKSISGFIKNERYRFTDKLDDKIHALEEWPLVLFTFIYAFLTGWILSFMTIDSNQLKILFLSFGIIGILLSAFHLGKPFRAPRSILNLKTSWLSREILFSGLFILSSLLYFFAFHAILLLIISTFFGLLLLLSIEMVYSIPKRKYKAPLHSSNTLLTALLFGFYFNGFFKLLVAVIVLKALLYLVRKKDIENFNPSWIVLMILIRAIVGLFIPLSILFFSNPIIINTLLLCLLIGELIDRFEFYNDIYIDSPSGVLDQTYKDLVTKENY